MWDSIAVAEPSDRWAELCQRWSKVEQFRGLKTEPR
jgi:hypothetical protein